jgi:hypothetical protein
MSTSDLTQLDVMLLENVLDALDRLFDSHSKAIDVCALLQATAHALSRTYFHALLSDAALSLAKIVRANLSVTDERDEALSATETLRHALAAELP